MAGPELLRTIDAVGIRNVPYVDYTTLWVEKQQVSQPCNAHVMGEATQPSKELWKVFYLIVLHLLTPSRDQYYNGRNEDQGRFQRGQKTCWLRRLSVSGASSYGEACGLRLLSYVVLNELKVDPSETVDSVKERWPLYILTGGTTPPEPLCARTM